MSINISIDTQSASDWHSINRRSILYWLICIDRKLVDFRLTFNWHVDGVSIKCQPMVIMGWLRVSIDTRPLIPLVHAHVQMISNMKPNIFLHVLSSSKRLSFNQKQWILLTATISVEVHCVVRCHYSIFWVQSQINLLSRGRIECKVDMTVGCWTDQDLNPVIPSMDWCLENWTLCCKT